MEKEGMDNIQTHQHTQCNKEGDNDGWKKVEKRIRKPKPFNTTTTYYFTDIPPGWNDLALWKTFAKYGRIADVYMAKKKSISGKAFGFARFFNVVNPKLFETTLNSIIIGTTYNGYNKVSHGHQNTNHISKPNLKPASPNFPSKPTGKTYAHTLSTNLTADFTTKTPPPTPLFIHSCPDLVATLSASVIGELFTIETFTNLYTIFEENDIPNIRIKYLGDLNILIEPDTDTKIETITSNPSISKCFKTLKPWDKHFHLQKRLTWLSIEGLPPHAWHEASFTRIASTWGEIIFPEKCNPSKNNLVAGKVCIRTTCMELIQTTMPILVDGVHICVRIHEIQGECDEICRSENKTDNESDNDSCTNHGGWIREDVAEKSLEDIESSPENNSNFLANSSQLMRKSDNETFHCFVKNNQIEESGSLDMSSGENVVKVDPMNVRDEEVSREQTESFVKCSLDPSKFPIQLPSNTQTQSSTPNSILGPIPSNVPILLKYNRRPKSKPQLFQPPHNTLTKKTKTQTKYKSLKLIHPLTGVQVPRKKTCKSKITKPSTPTVSTENTSTGLSPSNNDSNIERCNNRLINSTNPEDISENEVTKTIEVGIIIGYNMEGQELQSKSNNENCSFIHSLWGNCNCDFTVKKSQGNSGGIIGIWNASMFRKHRAIVDEDGFLAIYGEWSNMGIACLMIIVYAPQDISKKCALWDRLCNLILSFHAMVIVLGDFNEVCNENERLGTLFCKKGASLFNNFITNSNLVDLPMGGRKFTRMNKFGTKLSKIDRIFVSHHYISKWPNSQLIALPRELSDHCPLILKSHSLDYGPIPFKFFNSWLLNGDFPSIVSQGWSDPHNSNHIPNSTLHPSIVLKCKLQHLKTCIKT
ncbi:endonuclease/exonuclease/phosphatase family protein [Artemisia annua]|uniref:Endonuclease/exonuclease/phosphatase family protein n=1 Tax=Artemisia annua TaxID=35608 RepID=A0A2U1L3B8_ARTAN|nr:endonuclease/exonuclease/phosphatase family protein [Artemisia annua]